jgi:putative chitinase
MMDVEPLQRTLGVNVDGDAGVGTFTALFRKCGAATDRASDMAVCAARWFGEYGVMDSPLRLAHFLSQLMHESGSFRYMEELASGAAYEGRGDLGNVMPGDGVLFKGRGPLQITGRANYRHYGRKIGIDLEAHPLIAAVPSIGLLLALEYWREHNLNAFSDVDDVIGLTKAINGGLNGLDDRRAELVKIKSWLL